MEPGRGERLAEFLRWFKLELNLTYMFRPRGDIVKDRALECLMGKLDLRLELFLLSSWAYEPFEDCPI